MLAINLFTTKSKKKRINYNEAMTNKAMTNVQ